MEITQSLGSLLTPFYKNALVNRQVATGEYYRDLVKKEITAEVKRAWAYYQYAFHLCALYKEQIEWAGRLRKASQLRYEQGDITLLERNMSSTLVADLQTRLVAGGRGVAIGYPSFLLDLLFGFPITAYGYDIGFIPRSRSRRSLRPISI